jgi:hypothetical protein
LGVFADSIARQMLQQECDLTLNPQQMESLLMNPSPASHFDEEYENAVVMLMTLAAAVLLSATVVVLVVP